MNKSLIPASLRFPHPFSRTWTHISCNKNSGIDGKHQIDHILVRSKWINSVRNCRSYNTLDIGSDHRIVTAHFKISLRCLKKRKKINNSYNWEEFSINNVLQQRYAVEVRNKFELFHNCELEDAQSSYDAFEKCISSINEIVIPKKKKKKHKWISDRTDELIDKRKIAKQKVDKLDTLKNQEELKYLSNQILKSYKEDKQKYYENICGQLTDASKCNNTLDI